LRTTAEASGVFGATSAAEAVVTAARVRRPVRALQRFRVLACVRFI
jgi:hypothetical protein